MIDFRDSVLYVDADLPAPMVIDQIASHFEWAKRSPEAANRRKSIDKFSTDEQRNWT